MKKAFTMFASLFAAIMILAACSGSQTTEETQENVQSKIVISGDVVSEQLGCVLNSRFTVGDKIVFRANVVDGITGEQLKDAKLQVHLSTGEVLDMAYGEHAEDHFWVYAYPVTKDTPTGQLDYTVTAEYGRKTAEWTPFNVSFSKLQIVSEDNLAGAETEEKVTEEEPEVDVATVETNQKVEINAKNFVLAGPNGEKTFYVKAGEEVTLSLKNEEGFHGLAIADLKVNLDQEGEVKFTPETAGEYTIACSVFCGVGHGDMTAKLVVVE